ncbi:MAG: class I SAM-dependent methyltransferase [Myxococcota bacterium]
MTAAVIKDPDAALRHLYEAFPYPRSMDDLSDFREGRRQPTWNPKTSFPVFFPHAKPRGDLDILVAGCGTNLAPVFAATMPEARVVGIDISGASIALSKKLAAQSGLANIEHHELSIEEVGTLGRSFDFVCATGVIHHLADPAAGLRALAGVLADDGAMMVMVYAKYGRQGIYMLQELCRMLGMSVNELDAAKAQRLLALLPAQHPFRRIYGAEIKNISLEEVMDMVLNPRDVAYRVPDIRQLVDDAGLGFHRWLGNAEYRPELSSLTGAGLEGAFERLSSWDRAAAAELTFGNLIKHSFVLTHPARPTAEALFDGPGIADAVPTLSAHLHIDHKGPNLVATNAAHQVRIEMVAPVLDFGRLLKAADGTRTVGEIVGDVGEPGLDLYRRLYHADAIQLSTWR